MGAYTKLSPNAQPCKSNTSGIAEPCSTLSEERARRLAAETLAPPRSLGLAAGRSRNVLNAMHIIKEAFDDIPASSIVKC